jgi:CheY-like chemotaxis protein
MRKSERSSEIQLIGKSAAERGGGINRRGTVLVVEDNELIRELEADVLRAMGYDVAAVANTDDALKLLGDLHIALLVTDIRLPGTLGGIALARTAKQRRPDLKIMVVGVDVDQFAPEDLAGIADECLAKPFTVDEFEKRLRSAAGQHDPAAR